MGNDSLLQINRTEIDIGLQREYRFFQISDAHIAYVDENSSEVDIKDHERSCDGWYNTKREFATQFSELCDERYDVDAHLLFEALMEYAADFNPDAVILSGDIMDRVTESNIRYLKNYLSKYPKRVIYCLGNHATHDEYGTHRNMYDRFNGLVKNPDFDVFDFGEFEIVTLDNGSKTVSDEQIKKLMAEIQKGKKILLVIHIPLRLGEFGDVMGKKISGYFLMGSLGDDESAFELNKIIEENSSSFIAVLAGHIHTSVEYDIAKNLRQYTTSSALIGYGRKIIIK